MDWWMQTIILNGLRLVFTAWLVVYFVRHVLLSNDLTKGWLRRASVLTALVLAVGWLWGGAGSSVRPKHTPPGTAVVVQPKTELEVILAPDTGEGWEAQRDRFRKETDKSVNRLEMRK